MSSINGINGANGSGQDALTLSHLTWADPIQVELEVEQDRLRRELTEAKARLQAAKDRLVDRDEALHQALREELAVAQQVMADREEAHRQAVQEIRDEARREAARIIDQAANGSLDEPPVITGQVDLGQ